MKKSGRPGIDLEILREVQAQNRADEIRAYGRSVLYSRVHRNKKAYDRKKTSARRFWEDEDR